MYGILNEQTRTLNTYRKLNTIAKFAEFIIKSKLKEEDRIFVKTDILDHLTEWAETMIEINEDGDYTPKTVIDEVASNYVYTNAHYYNDRTPITSDEKSALYYNIIAILNSYV